MARSSATGTMQGFATYDPYGSVISSETTLSGVPFGFAGARWDTQAQKYSMGARHYDPVQGRFITKDTWPGNVWEPWTWNLYQYCGNSPQNYVDPTGHWQEGDETLPDWAQDLIRGYTDAWYEAQATGDKSGMDAAHAAAESIRAMVAAGGDLEVVTAGGSGGGHMFRDLGQGWRLLTGGKAHPGKDDEIHVYYKKERISSWDKDGDVNHKNKSRPWDVPRWVKEELRDQGHKIKFEPIDVLQLDPIYILFPIMAWELTRRSTWLSPAP